MKIRIINENDWEKDYYYDKEIIRIGSQLGCDIQLKGQNIQPIHLQLIAANGSEDNTEVRAFADGVTLTRGEQVQYMNRAEAYNLIEGDKITLENYRIIVEFGNDRTRVRTSRSIEAELFLYKSELEMDHPISGLITLKNIGTEHACQFHMEIHGLPEDCVRAQPMPYLFPGGTGTTGFVITHLGTRPEPGFHTMSITLTAPDDYFGEMLEFNQNIYVAPVFSNLITLTDDSTNLMNMYETIRSYEQERGSAQAAAAAVAIDVIAGQPSGDETVDEEKPVVVINTGDKKKADFSNEEDDEDLTQGMSMRGRKPGKKVVKKSGKFEGEAAEHAVTDTQTPAPAAAPKNRKPAKESKKPGKKESVQESKPEPVTEAPDRESKPEPVVEAPVQEIKPEPVQEVPVQESKPEPVQEAPVQEIKPEPVQEVPDRESKTEPVTEAPDREIKTEPVVEAPVQEIKPEPVQEAPVQESKPEPVVEAPVQESKPEPVQEVPVQESKTEPVKEAPDRESKPDNRLGGVPVVHSSGFDVFRDETGEEPDSETAADKAVKVMKGGSFDV